MSVQSSWKRTLGGKKEERTISSALVLLRWAGVKVQRLRSRCNSEGILLFVLCLPAKSNLFSGAPQSETGLFYFYSSLYFVQGKSEIKKEEEDDRKREIKCVLKRDR